MNYAENLLKHNDDNKTAIITYGKRARTIVLSSFCIHAFYLVTKFFGIPCTFYI